MSLIKTILFVFLLLPPSFILAQENEYGMEPAIYKLVQEKKPDEALKKANESIARDPSNSWLYFSRGMVYYFKNEKDNAIADLSTALRLKPTNRNALYRRATIYTIKEEYPPA